MYGIKDMKVHHVNMSFGLFHRKAALRDVAQEAATWAVCERPGASFDAVRMQEFQALFTFIKERGIPMTTPVLTACDGTTYSMRFKVDAQHAALLADAPGVTIEHTPARTMRVHAFDGVGVYATDGAIRRELAAIRESGVDVGAYFVAQYNSPFALYRHNEIWLPHG